MATTINSYSVSLGLAAGGFVDGATLARNEVTKLTRTLAGLATPAEKVAKELDLLEKAVNEGAIRESVYREAVKRLTNSLMDNSAAIAANAEAVKRDNALIAEGERLTRSLMTAEEKHAQELRRLDDLYKQAAIGATTYERAVAAANHKLLESQIVTAKIVKDPPKLGKLPIIDATVVDQTTRLQSAMGGLGNATASLGTRIAGVAVAAASFHTVENAVKGVIDRVGVLDSALKKAASIDADFNQLQRFVYMTDNIANIDSDSAVTMLTKLTKNIGEASLAGDKAGSHFKALGLSVAQLNNMSAVEQFDAVARAIRQVESPSERAAYAVKFFGKEGVNLVPMLMASNEELSQASDRFQELTYHISEIDAAHIAQAADAMADLGRATDSLKSKVAAELAPVFTDLANDLTNQTNAVRDGEFNIRGLGYAFKFAADNVRNLLLQAQGTKAFLDMLKLAGNIAEPYADAKEEMVRSSMLDAKLAEQNARLNTVADPLKLTADQLERIKKLDEETSDIDLKLQFGFEEQLAQLQKQIDLHDKTRGAVEYQLALERGLNDEQAAQIEAAYDQLDAFKAQNEALQEQEKRQEALTRQAEQVERSVMTPIEAIADKLNGLSYLLEVEEAIDQQTFNKAKSQLLEGAVKDIKIEAPKNLEVGSAEAYKFFSQRDNREQENALRAERKQEVERQINATLQVKNAVDDLKNNIKRKR